MSLSSDKVSGGNSFKNAEVDSSLIVCKSGTQTVSETTKEKGTTHETHSLGKNCWESKLHAENCGNTALSDASETDGGTVTDGLKYNKGQNEVQQTCEKTRTRADLDPKIGLAEFKSGF